MASISAPSSSTIMLYYIKNNLRMLFFQKRNFIFEKEGFLKLITY